MNPTRATPAAARMAELVSMMNSEHGLMQLRLNYLRLASDESSGAEELFNATPLEMIEAILRREFPEEPLDEWES